jgi:hypothetical protein
MACFLAAMHYMWKKGISLRLHHQTMTTAANARADVTTFGHLS